MNNQVGPSITRQCNGCAYFHTTYSYYYESGEAICITKRWGKRAKSTSKIKDTQSGDEQIECPYWCPYYSEPFHDLTTTFATTGVFIRYMTR